MTVCGPVTVVLLEVVGAICPRTGDPSRVDGTLISRAQLTVTLQSAVVGCGATYLNGSVTLEQDNGIRRCDRVWQANE